MGKNDNIFDTEAGAAGTDDGDELAGFVFLRSYFTALKSLPDADFAAIVRAVCEYGLDGVEPPAKLSGMARAAFELMRPNLDCSRERHAQCVAAGKAGGRKGKGVSRNAGNRNAQKSIANNSETIALSQKSIANNSETIAKTENQKQTIANQKQEKEKEREKEMERDHPQPPIPESGSIQQPAEGLPPPAAAPNAKEIGQNVALSQFAGAQSLRTTAELRAKASATLVRIISAFPAHKRKGFSLELLEWATRERLWEAEEQIMAALARWLKSADWQEEGGRFITSPENFLQKRLYLLPPPPEAITSPPDRTEALKRAIALQETAFQRKP